MQLAIFVYADSIMSRTTTTALFAHYCLLFTITTGASSCIVRNRDPSGKRPISDIALQEAGCMTVCRSNAWSQKIITSAWWVHADQVINDDNVVI
jgi:NFACT protein RNA binding domain